MATPKNGNTSGPVNSEKPEMDPKVREAFELAAKSLGFDVGFDGLYVFINQECPPEDLEKLKEVENECNPDTENGDSKDP